MHIDCRRTRGDRHFKVWFYKWGFGIWVWRFLFGIGHDTRPGQNTPQASEETKDIYRRRAIASADMAAMLYDVEPDQRLFLIPQLTAVQIDCLEQLWRGHRSDGDVNSKSVRGELVAMGLADRWNGWNFITKGGVAVLDALKGRGGMERNLNRVAQ